MTIIRFIVSFAVVILAGFIGQVATMPSIPTWYATLNKPFFNPPNWLFGPAWTLLYILMAVAFFMIWEKGLDKDGVKLAVGLFLLQLALNSIWSIIFFGLHSPLYAFVEIILLWLAILFTIIAFHRVSPVAGWLMVPYILWVSFASVLNLFVAILNR